MSQSDPKPGYEFVTDEARTLFDVMLKQREQAGVETYGTTLQTFNDRDVDQDLMEELVDAWQYAVQSKMERETLKYLLHWTEWLLRRSLMALVMRASRDVDSISPDDTVNLLISLGYAEYDRAIEFLDANQAVLQKFLAPTDCSTEEFIEVLRNIWNLKNATKL